MDRNNMISCEEDVQARRMGFDPALFCADTWDERPRSRRIAAKVLRGLGRGFLVLLRGLFLWLRLPLTWALGLLARLGIIAAVLSFLFYWLHGQQDSVVLTTAFVGIGVNMGSLFLLWLYDFFLDVVWSERGR